jgi:hypothetical protein
MIMEPPPGYPPPTLVRKRARSARLRAVLLFLVPFAAVGYFAANLFLSSDSPAPIERTEIEVRQPGNADSPPAALPDAPPVEAPQVIVEQPLEEGAVSGNAGDGRRANQWYFVSRLGDGPGAIYSRDGGQWNFAFACTTRTRMIEFIAVGTGSPGGFTDQVINIGGTRVDLDASYSKDGGGTIMAELPASHALFNALDGSLPMEVQLVADRKTIVPVGPNVVRLIKECRGRT